MIDKMKFIKAMQYVCAAYPNAKIDVTNEYQMSVWHDVLSDFDETTFIEILKDYVKHNEFAPQSPASITQFAKNQIIAKSDASRIFENLIKRIRDHQYDLDVVIKKYRLGGFEVIAKTIEQLYSNFTLWFKDSSQLPYVKRDFISLYESNFKLDVDKNVTQISSVKMLEVSSEN